MENKNRIVSLIFAVLLFFGCQTVLFGQNLKGTQGKLNDLDQRVDKFLKSSSKPTGKKLNNAQEIQAELKEIKEAIKGLSDEKEGDKIKIAEIDQQLDKLKDKFTNPNYVSEQNKGENRTTTQPKTSPTPSVDEGSSDIVKRVDGIENKLETILPKPFSWFEWALISLASLIIVGGIIAGVFLLRRNIIRERDATARQFGNLSIKQAEINKKITDLTEVTKNLSQQFAQSKAEISALKLANVNTSSYHQPPAIPVVNAYQTPREEPAFPVAVDDFLAKSKGGEIAVKHDYKERLLVADETGEGGLLVVRDGGGQTYLVPSFGFFQTKSDYTNYFERYYVCARPAGGSVWIRQPATVRQVSGGWELAGQGELEVR